MQEAMPSIDMSRFVGWCSRWREASNENSSSRIPLMDKARSAPERIRCENSLMLQLFALGAALTLLPYMGPDGLLKDSTFSATYRLWVSRVFPVWWILVCMGVPCTVWGRWWIEVQFGRLSTHLGMLGISYLVIMFSHWMLAVDAMIMPGFLLGGATLFFVVFWIRCCIVGDL